MFKFLIVAVLLEGLNNKSELAVSHDALPVDEVTNGIQYATFSLVELAVTATLVEFTALEAFNGTMFPAGLTQQLLMHQQHLQALHSLSHTVPGISPVPGAVPHLNQRSSEHVTEWSGTLMQPAATQLAVAGRTTTVSSATQETPQASVPVQTAPPVHTEVQSLASMESPASQPLSPLAAIQGHPGLIHHAAPDGLANAAPAQVESEVSHPEDLVSEDSPSPAGVLNLREAKRRKFFGGSPTKHHKQKGRKTRSLPELASRLN
jgi:hypothetical protein